MQRFIALLRGINVSGQKKIKMADLKILFEEIGFQNVVTYIQSGNVIFDAADNGIQLIKEDIEKVIKAKYNYTVNVEVRSKNNLNKVYENMPFENIDLATDGNKVVVTFLSAKPALEDLNLLNHYLVPPEKLIAGKQEIYLHCPNGYGKTKLSNTHIEKKLGLSSTTRNLKTVAKLCEMLKD